MYFFSLSYFPSRNVFFVSEKMFYLYSIYYFLKIGPISFPQILQFSFQVVWKETTI